MDEPVADTARMREAVAAEQESLSVTLQSIGAAVLAADAKGRVTKLNRIAEDLTGWPQAEAAGRPIEEVFRLVQATTGEGGAAGDKTLLARDGRKRLIAESATFLCDVQGEMLGSLRVFRDVTEERRAQKERGMILEILRILDTSAGMAELVHGVTSFFQQESGCEAVGIRLKEGEDYPYYEARGFSPAFVQAENRLCARNPAGELLRDAEGNALIECMCGNVIGGRFDPEKPFFTRAGAFWTNSTTEFLASTTEADRMIPMRNRCNSAGYESVALIPLRAGGARLGLLQLNDRRKGMFTPEDIASWERLAEHVAVALAKSRLEGSHRESERALRKSQEDFVRAQAVGQFGWWRLDIGKNILTWSDENHRMFGIPRGSSLSYETFLGAVHPEDREYVDTRWKAGMRGEPFDIEHRIIVNGEVRWVREKAYLEFEPAGKLMGGFGITQDITSRKLAEESLRELNETLEQRVVERTSEVVRQSDLLRALAVELSRAEQRERRRLAKVLHDHIQQLLVAARIQLEGVKRESHPEEFHKTVQGVESIINEAIDASRSLAVDLSPPLLHEAGLVGGLKWLASRMLAKNRFAVRLRVDERAEPADEDTRFLLFECARELLFNAMKHSGASEARVTLARTKANGISLAVRDEGKGFDAEAVERRQSEQPSLGLFNVRERLTYIGGRMEVETSPGKGAKVILTVPVGKADPSPEAEIQAARPAKRVGAAMVRRKTESCRVMIVDDHKIVRDGLKGLMQFESGIEVVGEAVDGPHAVELAGRLEPDVIIMDINLGKMSGVDATRRILAGNSHIKVIGLSMHIDSSVADTMRKAGAVACLSKGGPAEDVVAAIRACFKK